MALEPVLPAIPVWSSYVAVAVGGIAGASHAARRGFDVIGVLGLAVAAGLGGLLLRDVLLQKGTPVVLTDPRYLLSAIVAALAGFFFGGLIARLGRVLLGLDALAMGLFVSLGASAALFYQLSPPAALFLAVTTAVGGSILRDLLSGEPPSILRPGIFSGVAAVIGAIVFLTLYEFDWPTFWLQLATIVTVFAVRVLALWRGWESPTSVDVTERLGNFWTQTKDHRIHYHDLVARVHRPADHETDTDVDPAPAAERPPPESPDST
ncbi:MAG: hypothetical protein QG597_734 [Actinomycetota bacterium]|nr:hypothetical protein [Actinomycetota bacterium]